MDCWAKEDENEHIGKRRMRRGTDTNIMCMCYVYNRELAMLKPGL